MPGPATDTDTRVLATVAGSTLLVLMTFTSVNSTLAATTTE
ncbi:MAG: hypothetical protein QOF76_1514, partial [Solirubrobacteraceae bacterium]|nr:hypothetical protein [Solirubrobacteraceae bacterium]